MKKVIYIFFLIAISIVSCKDDEPAASGPVSNITYVSDYGSIVFSWENPAEAGAFYTEIVYTNRGKEYSHKSTVNTTEVAGFSDTEDYTFSFYAVNANEVRSEPTTIVAAPKAAAYTYIMPTVTVTPSAGGAVVAWTNVTGKIVTVKASYTDKNGTKQVKSSTSNNATGQIVITDMTPEVEQSISVTAGSGDVETEPKVFMITPEKAPVTDLDKTAWEVIESSSEETKNEGANGFAANVIDGQEGTFWHTKWSDSYAPTLPNYLVIDMKKTIEVYWVQVWDRGGKSATHNSLKTVEIYLSDDKVNYTKVGQMVAPTREVQLEIPTRGRYMKVNMPDSNNSGKHSMISEINAKGIE